MSKRTYITLIMLILIMLASAILYTPPSQPQDAPQIQASYRLYFPIVRNGMLMIGAQDEAGYNLPFYPQNALIEFSILWYEVEAVRGVYDWRSTDRQRRIDDSILATVATGRPVIIGVKSTPAWALDPGEPLCHFPKVEYWPDYLRVINAIRTRYGPWAIAVWNEPDQGLVMPNQWQWFGCEGNTYGAGLEYAQLLNYVSDNYRGRVIGGELAIHFTTDFVFGMVDNGISDSVDYISFHAYPVTPDNYTLARDYGAKLRQLGITQPLLVTETGYLSQQGDDCLAEPFYSEKRAYMNTIMSSWQDWGLDGVLWYTFRNGWRCSDILLSANQTEDAIYQGWLAYFD